jgi:C4-dicarboxylate transporter DctQ subunit
MMWLGWKLVQSMSRFDLVSPSLGINQKWPYSIIMVGFGLMICRMLQDYYRWLSQGQIDYPGAFND